MTTSLITRPGQLVAPSLDYVLLDASGSMYDLWYPLLAATDGFVDVLRTANIHSHMVVSTFNYSTTVGTIVYDGLLADCPRLGQVAGQCSGDTALYDAINFMGRDIARLAPERASVVIMTDGEESSSKHTDATQARAILDWMRAQGWQITFFGCDFDNSAQAKLLGATDANMIGVRAQKMAEATKLLADKRVRYAHGADEIGFTDDERTKFGGFLSHG